MTEFVMIVTLISIWSSLLMSSITLGGAVHFWLEHSRKIVDIVPLKRYPLITIVVPAHNEAVVIAQTTQAILEFNYPADKNSKQHKQKKNKTNHQKKKNY